MSDLPGAAVDAIDIDTPIYPFVPTMVTFAERRLNRRLMCAPSWDFWRPWGIDDVEFRGLLTDGIQAGVIYSAGLPAPGARDALGRRIDSGAHVALITSRGESDPDLHALVAAATTGWLEAHRIPYSSLVICQATEGKPVMLPSATTAMDDNPTHVAAWRKHGVRACLYDDATNRHVTDPHRTVGWDEALSFLEGPTIHS